MIKPVRILIVIRQPIIRHGLTAIVEAQPDFHVVATAANCAHCCQQVSAIEPDIILCDIEPYKNCPANGAGIDVCRAAQPDLPAIVIHDDAQGQGIKDATRLGVQGYLTMDAEPKDLFQAIRVVASGGRYVDENLHSVLLDLAKGKGENILSERERLILKLLSEGHSNQNIADTLLVSKGTAKHAVSAILGKLNVSNRTEAVSRAVFLGLL
ncbi:MAG: response regulator transcription factor [Thiotrichales bacterium]|nr:MAG: response regulator transcription factor [Thiotrichales bacterium]